MYSRFTSGINTTPRTVSSTTPATYNYQNNLDNAPVRSATQRQPAATRDFYIDTSFNPVWKSGPHVLTFAEDGTIVRPKTYAPEPYPGYYADRRRRLEFALDASHSQGVVKKDPKPWKNVAITEQDDAEFEAFQERMRIGAVVECGRHSSYYSGSSEPSPKPQEPELVYTWPPKPGAW